MPRFPHLSVTPSISSLLLVLGALAAQSGIAQTPTYDVRASTGDKVGALTGTARQGSFGSPSINDKGNIAYACVISGSNVTGTTPYTIVFRKKGKKAPVMAIQSGVQKGYYSQFGTETVGPGYTGTLFTSDPRTINDDMLVRFSDSNTKPVLWSGRMFRISKDVAINNVNKIAFAGQLIETVETVTRGNTGNITRLTARDEPYSAIGVAVPFGNTFTNSRVVSYREYNAEILTRTTSINNIGRVPFDGNFPITANEDLPGFAFNYPYSGTGYTLVATTASNVIGLPYFTTFTGFSNSIISGNNVCYVVANLSDTGADFDGIWQGSNPNLQPVVTIQSTPPTGGKFSAFDGKVGPSPKGAYAAFIASATGGTVSRGVFRSTKNGSSIVKIAAVGDEDPEGLGTFQEFTLASVNDRGKVAFLATVRLAGGGTQDGIWVSDPAGENLRQMVVTGQSLQVKKKLKKITKLAFSPISGLNKKGQIAFTASFSDRTSSVVIAK